MQSPTSTTYATFTSPTPNLAANKIAGTLPDGRPYTFAQLVALTKTYEFHWNAPAIFVAALGAVVLGMAVLTSLGWAMSRCFHRFRIRSRGAEGSIHKSAYA